MTARSVVKRLAERVARLTRLDAVARRRMRARTLVLAYHDIVPDGAPVVGDASLHLPQREFARQLDCLTQTHRVIPLHDMASPESAEGPPCAVITFDDAYEGAITSGLEELARRGLPSTVFVAPGLLGGTTWWDALATPSDGGVPPRIRDHALGPLAGRGRDILEWAAASGISVRDAATLPTIATEAQLLRAASLHDVGWGAHSWSHPNLAAVPPDELSRELVETRGWLEERFQTVQPWIAYPYGLFSPQVERAAAAASYRGAFRVDGGYLPEPAARVLHALPRYNVPAGLSLDGFALRLAGIGVGS